MSDMPRQSRETVLRILRHERNFTMVANTTADDKQLSYEANGLLVSMLSKPDGWRFSADRLARARSGRKVVLRALRELEAVGYVRRIRYRDGLGRIRTETVVAESPELLAAAAPPPGTTEIPEQRSERPGRTGVPERNGGARNAGPGHSSVRTLSKDEEQDTTATRSSREREREPAAVASSMPSRLRDVVLRRHPELADTLDQRWHKVATWAAKNEVDVTEAKVLKVIAEDWALPKPKAKAPALRPYLHTSPEQLRPYWRTA